MENLVLILIGFLVLAFVWGIWIRQSLFGVMNVAEQKRQILKNDLGRMRDTVPYLLEFSRHEIEESSQPIWRKLLEDRKFFHKEEDINKAIEYERELLQFLQNTHLKNVHFMEAKKDIFDLSGLVEKEKTDLEVAMQTFNEKRNKFPYKQVSAIFGLHELSL